jgi:hypothetical protein
MYDQVVDEITNALLDMMERIKANLAEKGINASGRTSAGLQVQRYETGVRLVLTGQDVAPLATLEVGRAGGKVPLGFADIIEQWSRDKGLAFPTEGDRRSFAYLTARKIAREGTERHKSPIDVYSEEVERGLSRIRQNIKVEVTKYIHSSLIYK